MPLRKSTRNRSTRNRSTRNRSTRRRRAHQKKSGDCIARSDLKLRADQKKVVSYGFRSNNQIADRLLKISDNWIPEF